MSSTMRMSRQRRVIMEVLRNMKTHPGADEVFREVKKTIPNVSLGTVYRNLDFLASRGDINRLECSGSMRFDGDTGSHHHVRCANCQRIDDLPELDINDIKSNASRFTSFNIDDVSLTFIGLCPECHHADH